MTGISGNGQEHFSFDFSGEIQALQKLRVWMTF
jgi:hypothetical protein